MIYKKYYLGFIIGLVFILGWSPWLSNNEVREIVRDSDNFQYQHTAEKDTANPEIHVTWLPFCRWATTYEDGWPVCFWHGLKKDSNSVTESSRTTVDEPGDGKNYVDNEFREKEITKDTYLKSLAPMVVYSDRKNSGISINAVPFRETGEFIGVTLEGKEVILDIPKVDFFNVSSVVFDKNSDTVYYKDGRLNSVSKIDIARKTTNTLISSVSGEVKYADKNVLLTDDGVFHLYDPNTGAPIQPQNVVHVADSGEYKVEYRVLKNNTLYQIVFDNQGGTVLRGYYQGFQSSSDSMKVHFNKIGTLNREYITKNNIAPYDYLRSVYDDQNNTKLYYTQTTGDIWPTSNAKPKLVLYPTHPVFTEGYHFTYYTMGNLYDIGDNKYAQVIGDGLVTFDTTDMSVKFIKDKEEIKSMLLNKQVIAIPDNSIETAGTPAGCEIVIDSSIPYQGIAGIDVKRGSKFQFPRVLDGRSNSSFAYCLR